MQTARNTAQKPRAIIPEISTIQETVSPQTQIQESAAAEAPQVRNYLDKVEARAARNITGTLGIQNQEGRRAVRTELKVLRQKIMDGTVAQEDVQAAFDRIIEKAADTDPSRRDGGHERVPFDEEAVAYEAQRSFDETYASFVQDVKAAKSQFAEAQQTEQIRTAEDATRLGNSLQNAQRALGVPKSTCC